jgi:hypothetical protein
MIKVDVKIKNNKYLMIEEYTLVRARSHVFLVKLFAYSRGRATYHVPLAGNKRACDVCQIKRQKTKTRAVGWQQTSM